MPIDYKKYPSNWKTEIVPSVRERSMDQCEICNVKNNDWIYRGFYHGKEAYQDMDGNIFYLETGRKAGMACIGEITDCNTRNPIKIVLTVAHLDHDVNNNKMDNLKHLCQLHHLRHDIEKHKETRKLNKLKKQPELWPIHLSPLNDQITNV